MPFRQQPCFSIFDSSRLKPFSQLVRIGQFVSLGGGFQVQFLRFVEITGDQPLHGEGRALLDRGYRRQGVDGRALGSQAGGPQLVAGRGPVVERWGAVVVVEVVEVLGAVA